MWQAASKLIPAWQEQSTYIDPNRGIFNNDRSKIGLPINHKILLDSHASHAKRVTSSGMMTGMTDPASKWFKLTMDNFTLENVPGATEWLDEVTNRMYDVFAKSNLYKVFQNTYDELVTFGTGCFLILEDFDDVVRGRSFTIGEYYLATDSKGRVNSFAREFEMTVGQLVDEFGLESCSMNVKAYWANNQPDILVKVRHLIEPNKTRIAGMEDFKNMPYRSVYWEMTSNSDEQFLAHRGYKRFPVVAPRWETVTTDMVYGYGPGRNAIGDIKQLQVTTKDKLIAQQKSYDPPTVEDANVIGNSNRLPGGTTKSSAATPNSGLRAAYEVDPHIEAFNAQIEYLHQEIDKFMFSNIFLMITQTTGDQTAFEIAKREQEKLTLLGPLLHSLNEEMHDEVIDIVFDIMNETGMIPPPPEGLQGDIRVQYTGILAQAQKIAGVQTMQGTIMAAANLVPVIPDIMDNYDTDEFAELSSTLSGNPAKLLRSDSEKQAIRDQRAQQLAKQQALESGTQMADAASKLGKTPANQGSVLDKVAQTIGGR